MAGGHTVHNRQAILSTPVIISEWKMRKSWPPEEGGNDPIM